MREEYKDTLHFDLPAQKKARALYQKERRQQKEREKSFTQELHQKFPR